ncbi:MAG: FHA domain-containing protein [Prevotella sp.]|nr:FHA domain-containing protein [Prevotella sp.]
MKRIRCPKCSNYITFDDKKYTLGQALAFNCPYCGHRFAVRLGGMKKKTEQPQPAAAEEEGPQAVGSIVVIENIFHYKQVIPLYMGDNVIGRYQRGVDVNCPIHTDDPSIDMTHCVISVSRDKKGGLKFILRDGPSNTGTFVDNEILGDRERRTIGHGTLFTIGATSVILKTEDDKDE